MKIVHEIKFFGLKIGIKALYRWGLLIEKEDLGKARIIIKVYKYVILRSKKIENPATALRCRDEFLHILEPITYKTMRRFNQEIYEATRKILKEGNENE